MIAPPPVVPLQRSSISGDNTCCSAALDLTRPPRLRWTDLPGLLALAMMLGFAMTAITGC